MKTFDFSVSSAQSADFGFVPRIELSLFSGRIPKWIEFDPFKFSPLATQSLSGNFGNKRPSQRLRSDFRVFGSVLNRNDGYGEP